MPTTVDDLFDEVDGGIVLRVHAQPGGSRAGVTGLHERALRVRVTSRPVDGAANEAVCRVVADLFEVRPRSVTLVGGPASRSKRLRVEGVTAQRARSVLQPVIPT